MKKAVPLYIGTAALCMVGFAYTLYQIFYVAPLAQAPLYYNQKIFYYHVPCAFMLFAAVITCGIASIKYLRKREERWDDVAFAAAEVAVMFGLIVLVTGVLWAKPAWDKWWVWDARLTSALLLWMTMLAYMLVRKYGGAGAERLAAGLGIFAMINIPLVYASTRLWKTNHPSANTVPSLDSSMRAALWLSVLLFTFFFILLLRLRIDAQRAERRLYRCREMALDAGLFE
ncbi:MAG: cytochrome c biogenesis protein CcsA [Kofleriaceae bacterium]|nr:cytochrome c biogenesis protein CcsA [Kofleriaceae bacterium]